MKMIRPCIICGKDVREGMTDQEDFNAHEECFPAAMDKVFGKHRWMEVDEEMEAGGYYVTWMAGEVMDTGIFWTDWEDE